MIDIKGIIPYLVTPVNADGTIRAPVLGALCEDLISQGVHGLTPLGSTGEFAYLDDKQRRRTVEVVVEATNGRVPVLPGVASTSTAATIAQARAYQASGVDGLVVVCESYFPLNDREMENYFLAVADAVDLPLVIYTNPNFQRSDLSVSLIERLSEHPNIVGLKDASTNTGRLLSIINRCEGKLDIYAASSHIAACVMLIGGKGWFAGPACVLARECVALYDLCRSERWPEAMRLQKRLWEFNEVFARYGLAACVKQALQLRGFDVGDPVPPQSPASDEAGRAIAAALAKI